MVISSRSGIFFIFLLLFALNTKTTVTSWNDASRMATIQSIVEDGSLSIDNSMFAGTGDKYQYKGHFYSDKPPMLSIIASPVYFVLNRVGLSFESHGGLIYYLLTLIVIGIPSAFGMIVFRDLLIRYLQVEESHAGLFTLFSGSASLVMVYSVVFNNHIISGVLLIMAFFLLLEHRRKGQTIYILLSALVVSLAGSIDITCFIFLPFFFVILLLRSPGTAFIYGVASLPIIILYLYLNRLISGSIIPPALNVELWDYPGSGFSEDNLSGMASHESFSALMYYAFHMILGSRGLLSLTPLMILAFAGMLTFIRIHHKYEINREYGFLLLAALLFVILYIVKSVNYSGNAFGVRWYATVSLIFCLSLSFLAPWFDRSAINRAIFLGIAALSTIFALSGSYSPFSPGIGFDVMSGNTIEHPGIMNFHLIINETQADWKIRAILSILLISTVVYFILHRIKEPNKTDPIL